jgi:hypothetical protein
MRGFTVISKTLLLASCAIAYAQPEPGQWVEDLYLVQGMGKPMAPPHVFIDENNVIRKTIPSIADALDFPVPVEQRQYAQRGYWYNDAFYITAFGRPETNENGEEFRRWTLAKWEDDEWHFVGECRTDASEFLSFIPCDNSRFIAIFRNADLPNNKGANRTPFFRASIPEGKMELKMDSPIAYGMDDLDMTDPNIFGLASRSRIIIADGFAVLISKSTGLYWVFSLETASLKRTGKVFKDATAKWISNGGNSGAVYYINPEKDGAILLSAHPDEALDEFTGDIQRESNEMARQSPMTLEAATKWREERRKVLDSQYPFFVWHRIEPESGRSKKAEPPPIGASLVKDDKIGPLWRPMPDGAVKMGRLHLNEDEPKKTEEKKDEENKNALGKTDKVEQTASAISDKQIAK